jgi:hypothetical protein
MKSIRFHPDADSEMVDAAQWYEIQQEGLGKRFLTSVQDALKQDRAQSRNVIAVVPESEQKQKKHRV